MFSSKRYIILVLFVITAAVPFTISEVSVVRSANAKVGSLPVSDDPPTESIRLITLPTNDLVFNAADEKLYASVPSSAGGTGNSIRTIDPRTGLLGDPVFIGSEPTKLAMANDGQTLYVALDGAYAVRRYSMVTQTAGSQFSLGWVDPTTNGRYLVSDMAVAPDNPNIVAVARRRPFVSPPGGGVAVFDGGVQRPATTPGHSDGSDYLAFSGGGSVIYGTGQYNGLKTMVIDPSGIYVVNSASVGSGARIKFSGGMLFDSSGRVIDPVNQTLLGTFPLAVSPAFVPDHAAGRAYYVVKNVDVQGKWTVKAFDINTFELIGSFNISNVAGDAASLVRWGSNGLAFRTTQGQVYLIQTNLIPSSEPIPTPTETSSPSATPTATQFETHYSTVPVSGNGVVYDSATQKLYVTVPSSMGSTGNSIATVDPISATVENSVYIGSEPNQVVLTGDKQSLYVELAGAREVRKFDIATQTPGIQFPVGINNFDGPLRLVSLDVAPDDPSVIAVARRSGVSSPGGVGNAIFKNGSQLPNISYGASNNISFSSSSNTFYGAGGIDGLQTMTINANGVASYSTTPYVGSVTAIKYANGLVYGNTGPVIDPSTRSIVGTFPIGIGSSSAKFVVDTENDRIFFLNTSGPQITAFDLNTFLPIGTISPPSMGVPTDIKRWGSNGLVITNSNGRLTLIRSTLVDPSEGVPTMTPTPTPTPTVTPTPFPRFIRRVAQASSTILDNPLDEKIYASVHSRAANGTANTITRIDPATGSIVSSVPIGNEPNHMALSDDGRTLYVSLANPNAVRTFNTETQTPGSQFSAVTGVRDLVVKPGSPETVVVAYGSDGAAIYDNGVQRPSATNSDIGYLAFLGPGDVVYGYNNLSTAFELFKFSIDPAGLHPVSSQQNLVGGFSSAIEAAEGKLFMAAGQVVDPVSNRITGTFSHTGGSAIAVDTALRKAFIADSGAIIVFDIDTYLKLGTIAMPNEGTPTKIVRWGVNGLAVHMHVNFDEQYINLVQSPLVSDAAPIPSGISLTAAMANTNESAGSVSISVERSGDVSGTSTVQYSTADGTAEGGVDFTAVTGSLTFGPGETIRTFSVPIINDAIYEGHENFTVGLAVASGAYLVHPSTAVVTIFDNDNLPRLAAADTRVNEARAGQTSIAQIPVTLSNPSVQTVTVNYATANGSAMAGTDYDAVSGVVTFEPLETSKSIPVTIRGDNDVEGNESFSLVLSNPVNGFITISSAATVTIEDSLANDRAQFDYDGDGKTDMSVFRPSTGDWYLQRSTAGFYGVGFGAGGDKLAPADYEGDGKTDIAVYRPSTGIWYVTNSSDASVAYHVFGIGEDLPTPADYDGDGKADISVFRPSTGTWYRTNSSDGSFTAVQFGQNGDRPTIGDFDGDGKADVAVFRPATGAWYQINSGDGSFFGEQFGNATDKIAPADYDGDGKTDIGIYRPSEGLWYYKNSGNGAYTPYVFGLADDFPVAGDYDGDGKADIGVFRPSDGYWYIVNSSNGSFTILPWGQNGDIPTPNAFGN